MKKLFVLTMAFLMLAASLGGAAYAAPVKTPVVYIDGVKLNVSGQQPVMQSGRTLVPMRAIFEALGAEIKWDPATRTVTALKKDTSYAEFIGDKTIRLTLGSTKAHIESKPVENPNTAVNKDVTLDVPAQTVNGSTMVPLAFVSQALDCHVKWDGKAYRVDIYKPQIKEYWYQQDSMNFNVTKRYDLWSYKEELEPFKDQVYLRTVGYGDTDVKEFYAFFVQRVDSTQFNGSVERDEMEAHGTVNKKKWNISYTLFILDDETRELKEKMAKTFVNDVRYKGSTPDYSAIPFSISNALFL